MILGINGPIGSGKNEVAKILEKNWGYTPMGFADKLKESSAALFGIEPELWNFLKNDDSAKISLEYKASKEGSTFLREISISAREFLKRYGTESHRDVFGYNFWVDALLDRENSHMFSGNVAIYDARFDNELQRIREVGGKNIQVIRHGHDFDPSHPSETAPNPDLIDFTIVNSGTLKSLEYKVNYLVTKEKLQGRDLSAYSNILSPSP
jgi:deoxynucleotide monophosphate kinase-like protein